MGMNLFELHSYLQFTYEYVEESLMLKSRIIHWKKIKTSLSYAKLSTVATTLANEAGLFPANYADISGLRTQESFKTRSRFYTAVVILPT